MSMAVIVDWIVQANRRSVCVGQRKSTTHAKTRITITTAAKARVTMSTRSSFGEAPPIGAKGYSASALAAPWDVIRRRVPQQPDRVRRGDHGPGRGQHLCA